MNIIKRPHLCLMGGRKFLASSPPLPSATIAELPQRSLIRVQGEMVREFLQSLITNDINHLTTASPSLFAMFLNKSGRILYDALIYQSKDNGPLFIECDSQIDQDLKKHLQLFRVRKKIDIDIVRDEMKVLAAFNSTNDLEATNVDPNLFGSEVTIYTDPRLKSIGHRILAPVEWKGPTTGQESYKEHILKLGIGEGIVDLPAGKSFPLEANCDYLHGVSFHKGCYLGQEFTARTHHTGTIRKRLMPIQLIEQDLLTTACSSHIESTHGAAMGKLRSFNGKWALGLLKVDAVLKETSPLVLGGAEVHVTGRTFRPTWWPTEAPKLQELRENKE